MIFFNFVPRRLYASLEGEAVVLMAAFLFFI